MKRKTIILTIVLFCLLTLGMIFYTGLLKSEQSMLPASVEAFMGI